MERFDNDFIKRCEQHTKCDVEEFLETRKNRVNQRNKNNREKLKMLQKIYEKTEKGKIARKRTMALSGKRIRNCIKYLNIQEKEAVRNFYVLCPKGFEVDHIIPLSKGGMHRLDNLQYLPKIENRIKKDRIYYGQKLSSEINNFIK